MYDLNLLLYAANVLGLKPLSALDLKSADNLVAS